MVTATDKPPAPALRVLRAGFAALLVLSLAFCITMAAWGELRDALFVRLLDTRYAKSFVFRAPQGARVWLGDKLLGTAQLPVIADSEPEAVIDGLTVREARVYADEKTLLKHSVVTQAGAAVEPLAASLARGRTVARVGRERLAEGDQFVPVLLRQDGRDDAALLCTLEIPQREGGKLMLAFLLRLEHEGVRMLEGCELSARTIQLSANEHDFWTTRAEYSGLPRQVQGQLRTSWLFWPRLASPETQTAALGQPDWLELPHK
ncbi:MAG: hypothetical protein HS108_02420 [Planctomycetes bacterium]|jgi:hypothetical protein|nr:hypothetical protein [Planctomycetota bacterium]MCL4731619.1 hypothetical protein [Planctomycetota bacterium]